MAAERIAPAEYGYDGSYEPAEAAGYLLVGIPAHLQARNRPTPLRVQQWIREGLIAPEQRAVPARERKIDFEDLISAQVITLFRQKRGLSLKKIHTAERYFAQVFGVRKPFAHQNFWFSPVDILASFGEEFVLSGVRQGQIGWRSDDVLRGMDLLSDHLGFGVDGRPVEWEPAPGITLSPDVQFGQACVRGTRIPTSALWSYHEGGDRLEFIAEGYGIEVADVERAVAFERQIRAVLADVRAHAAVLDRPPA
jgi:uncharacterized protein (DUF433 family)